MGKSVCSLGGLKLACIKSEKQIEISAKILLQWLEEIATNNLSSNGL